MMIKEHIKQLTSEHGVKRSFAKVLARTDMRQFIKQESKGNGGALKLAHISYYFTPNAGDTVLSHCVRKTIESNIGVCEWEIIRPNSTVNDSVIDCLNDCEKIIIGGGGLFLPDSSANSISGWQWPISNDQLKRITSPIIVYSVGYNYFRGQEKSKLFEQSVRTLVECSSFFGLRNHGSIRTIQQLLPDYLQSKVIYQPCTTTIIRNLYPQLEKIDNTGNVAVNMAFDRENLRYGNDEEVILSKTAKAIKQIENRGYRIFYVCNCWNDDRFLLFLRNEGVNYTLCDLSHGFPDEILGFYNNMDFVIGMRGHAQMIPFGLNKGILSLGTHDKMRWFLEDIDAVDWYVDLNNNISDLDNAIYEKFIQVHETEKKKTERRLIDAQLKLWEITQNNLRIIGGDSCRTGF